MPVKATAKPTSGQVTVTVELQWPNGWKTNELAKMGYFLFLKDKTGAVDRTKVSNEKIALSAPTNSFSFQLPVTGSGKDNVRVEVPYYYCQKGDSGICKYGQVAFEIELTVAEDGKQKIVLPYDVPE